MMEMNGILFNCMTNSGNKQAYVHVFDYIYITFKKAVNMFERMAIGKIFMKV